MTEELSGVLSALSRAREESESVEKKRRKKIRLLASPGGPCGPVEVPPFSRDALESAVLPC